MRLEIVDQIYTVDWQADARYAPLIDSPNAVIWPTTSLSENLDVCVQSEREIVTISGNMMNISLDYYEKTSTMRLGNNKEIFSGCVPYRRTVVCKLFLTGRRIRLTFQI